MASETTDSHETLMQFLYRAPIGLVQTSITGTIEMLNPMSAQLLMPLSSDGNLENLFTVLQEVAPELSRLLADFDKPSGVVCDSLRVALDTRAAMRTAPQVLSISLLKVDGARLMAVLADATLEVQREQQERDRGLHDAARIDHLTQMPNRAAVREQLQRMMARLPVEAGLGFAVLFMNCDRFKQINDTLGHAAGDTVLAMMAERLGSTLRPQDRISVATGFGQMAARIGGDEFVVILDGMRRLEDVQSVALRLLDLLDAPYGTERYDITCNVSIGVAMASQTTGNAHMLLQDASIAMVEAKRAGGARYAVFEPAMRERAEQRGDTEVELRRALAERELFVVYQPVLALLPDGSVDRSAGVEALVRWHHPLRGIVPPVEFIGVAEASGLIGALGDFVLETACSDFMQWQQTLGALAPRLLAVNLSRAQLAEPGLKTRVAQILSSAGMAPAALQLEVTESLAVQDERMREHLGALKSLGLKLALDDFGTGYSSLSCLHLLPVDTVKIDRTFVSQSDTSAHHRVLIEATVRVAHSLGMDTVAEGIETIAQAEVVRQIGCDKVQGYLFSKPLVFEDLVCWLQDSVVQSN
ncbi:MAG: bifunctional diguanylate cyclase/phosphodiesterase [Herminiimonas sp.]|nr:bifunctional diguanylate cyclase/phosphodiesterase [Herminiimonas sp.]